MIININLQLIIQYIIRAGSNYSQPMGTNTSKIKDIIFVTSTDLDPPQLHAKRQYKPQKEVNIQYSTYGQKKYYKQNATDQELSTHLQKIQQKQDILKQFKHHKDFDRIDFLKMGDQVTIYQYFLQSSIKLCAVMALALSRAISVHFYFEYFTVATWRRLFIPSLLMMLPSSIYRNLITQEYHIINHQYFRMLPQQQAQYVQLDLKHDIYKDVDDIKYKYKYPTLKEYYKTRRFIFQSVRDNNKSMYKELYQYQLGLKPDPLQQFANFRQKQRKGNWDILTPQQKVVIQQELKLRQPHPQTSKNDDK